MLRSSSTTNTVGATAPPSRAAGAPTGSEIGIVRKSYGGQRAGSHIVRFASLLRSTLGLRPWTMPRRPWIASAAGVAASLCVAGMVCGCDSFDLSGGPKHVSLQYSNDARLAYAEALEAFKN